MKNKLLTITLILLLIFSSLTFLAPTPTVKANPDWLSGWSYRKSHVINPASGAGTGYQVCVKAYYGSGTDSGENVYLAGKCRTDFGDVRFTDDDGTTLLSYYLEIKVDGNWALFWVKINDDLSTNPATIYIYYGKSDATTTSSKASTVLNYEDFESGTLGKFSNVWGFDFFSVTSSVVKEGTYAAQANDPSSSGSAGRYSSDGTFWSTDDIRITWWMRCDATSTSGGLTSVYLVKGSTLRMTINIQDNGVFNYWDGSTHTFGTASKGVWYKFIAKLCLSATKWDLEVRDVNDSLLYSFTDLSMASQSVSYRDVFMYSSAYLVGLSYWDNFFTLKYVKPEPAHGSWGSEETPAVAIERSASQTLTIIPVSSRQTVYDRVASQSFQILVAASRQLSLPRLASQLVNFVADATRQMFLSRTASTQLLMLTQTSRQSSYARTAIQSLNILMQSARELSYQRPINIPLNILSEATRLTTVARTPNQILTILSEATYQRILHRFVNQPLEMLLSATRETSYYRGVDQFFSILTETTRQSTLYRIVNQPLEMLLSATRLTTATRTSSQILTILTETTRQSILHRFASVPFSILSEATRLRIVTRTANQIFTMLTEATRESTLNRFVHQPLQMLISAVRQMFYHRTAEIMLQFNTRTSIKFIIYVEVPTPAPAPAPVPVMPSIQLDAIIQTAHITSLWWQKTSTIEVLVINKGTIASDVTFQYQVIDQQNNIVAEGTQTIFISGLDKKTVYVNIPTPPDGTYTVHFKTTSPVKVEAKTVTLIVETPFYGKLTFTILIILLAALAIYLAGKRRR